MHVLIELGVFQPPGKLTIGRSATFRRKIKAGEERFLSRSRLGLRQGDKKQTVSTKEEGGKKGYAYIALGKKGGGGGGQATKKVTLALNGRNGDAWEAWSYHGFLKGGEAPSPLQRKKKRGDRGKKASIGPALMTP